DDSIPKRIKLTHISSSSFERPITPPPTASLQPASSPFKPHQQALYEPLPEYNPDDDSGVMNAHSHRSSWRTLDFADSAQSHTAQVPSYTHSSAVPSNVWHFNLNAAVPQPCAPPLHSFAASFESLPYPQYYYPPSTSS